MQLEKLTKENITIVLKKKIYCWEKSVSYLNELCDKFPVLDNIVAIIDEEKRNQGEFVFQGTVLSVYEPSMIKRDDLEKCIIITSDFYREVYDRICQMEDLVDENASIYYFPNRETEYELEFREKYRDAELQDIIVFRSGPHSSSYVKGMDFADNARALFEYMLKQNLNKKYKLVWLVKNPKEYAAYAKCPNVKFVAYDWSVSEDTEERAEYYRVLCLAKYLLFTDAYGFARNCREDQIRVQLWHGCGFKTRVKFVRCEHRYEYTTVISDLYAKIHANIYGLRDDQVLITGYPKEDWLFHPIEKEVLWRLGVPKARKYIFWLPTFRTTEEKLGQLNEYRMDSVSGLPILDTAEKLQAVNNVLVAHDMKLVIKLHPFQKKDEVNCDGYSNIYLLDNNCLLEYDIQINQILGYADALLSDYSSAAVDYLLLDRPIGFTLDDLDRYANSRGFVFDNIKEWLPGAEIYDADEFVRFVGDIAVGIDVEKERRQRIRAVMHDFDDDRSCERVVKKLGLV